MKHLIIIFSFLAFSYSNAFNQISLNNISKNGRENITQYTITINKNHNKKAQIVVSFIPKNDTLYMAPGAYQLPNRWATFVSDLQLLNKENAPVEISELGGAKWLIKTPQKGRVTLKYNINLTHDEHRWGGGIDGVAFNTDWGVFSTTRAFLILNGSDRTNIEVNFKIDDSWKLTTSWTPKPNNKHSYIVHNYEELTQSMFFAGTQEEILIDKGGFKLVFALGGDDVLAKKEYYANMASGVLNYYEKLMKGLPKLDSSTFTVFINSWSKTDGEAIGNNISLLVKKDAKGMDKNIANFIFAHEFFHLWNGKSFFPKNPNTVEWFKEGYSNYYTLKALFSIGYLSEDEFLSILDDLFYQSYINDDGLGKIPAVQGEEKHNHWGLIYAGGMFNGIAQDIEIRLNSNNTKSLDDLMRNLFQNYSGSDKAYTIQDLQEMLSNLSGKDQTEFFKDYIYGTKRIPIENYMSRVGFSSEIKDNKLQVQKKINTSAFEQDIINSIYGNELSKKN
ncbi:M61 family metallopeptidase [Pontimicrobium aquaticum]|uniref:Uncharacterized protein n=1 Tax=Pontimicrobium aquaticum TaxID=2565367 RepID=A0A4U0F0E3_9FLAO|nr:hypothetical protein [Pontimicrobium aquaticum]TJY37826.1 hypothetical protein E5167_00800 [Pontimicrobium aquaticum]